MLERAKPRSPGDRGLLLHILHQRRDARLPDHRRQLPRRAPDVAEAIEFFPQRQPVGGICAGRGQRGGDVAIRCPGIHAVFEQGGHGCGGRQQASGLQLAIAALVVLGHPRRDGPPRGCRMAGRQSGLAGRQALVPQRFAPKLDEIGEALAARDRRIERLVVDAHVLRGERHRQRLLRRGIAQATDPQQPLAKPIPKRGVGLAEVRQQPRRTRQHQHERGVAPDVLADVQQNLGDIQVQRVGFVHQHCGRPPAAARDQTIHEIGRGGGRSFPLRLAHPGNAQLGGQPPSEAANRQQSA